MLKSIKELKESLNPPVGLFDLLKEVSPTQLAKARGKRLDTSSRDKILFLKKVAEIEEVATNLGIQIIVRKQQ